MIKASRDIAGSVAQPAHLSLKGMVQLTAGYRPGHIQSVP